LGRAAREEGWAAKKAYEEKLRKYARTQYNLRENLSLSAYFIII
jgi:hypothetical protein